MTEKMTRESCTPTDSVKSEDDYFNFVYYTGIGIMLC